MAPLWWQMPGPYAFAERVAVDLRDCKNVIVNLPTFSKPGMYELIDEMFTGGYYALKKLNVADCNESPVHYLFEHFIGDEEPGSIRSAAELVRHESFKGWLIWVEGINESSRTEWEQFIDEYAHACRNRPCPEHSLFCLVVVGEKVTALQQGDGVALAYHYYYDVVTRLDMWIYLARMLAGAGMWGLERELFISTVAELALWDPIVADRFSVEGMNGLTYAAEILFDLARDRDWHIGAGCNTVSSGQIGYYEGKEYLHSAMVAVAGDERELKRRAWSGQVRVLLPYVEEKRSELLKEVGPYLRIPYETRFGEVIDEPRKLEIGQIYYQIKDNYRISFPTRDLAKKLLQIRNKLSHLDIVNMEELKELFSD